MNANMNHITSTTVWEYADDPTTIMEAILRRDMCLYCKIPLARAFQSDWESQLNELECDNTDVRLCRNCGWWTGLRYEKKRTDMIESTDWTWGSYGILKNLDLADVHTPIDALRDYLAARYERRHDIHPRLMEETVASVFKDLGYTVELTAYSGDGGIDVILFKDGERIGVQVKRYRDAIEAEQIRSFVGALVIRGYTKGVFVTTSRFSRGAKDTAESATYCGYPIELIDAHRLYEVLGIAQTQVERSSEEWLKIVRPRLSLLDSRTYKEAYYLK